MAMVIPRSLNDPVGLAPSNFSHTSASTSADSTEEWIRGVPPSRSVTTGVVSLMGRRSRYSSRSPRH